MRYLMEVSNTTTTTKEIKMTVQQIEALRAIGRAILEAVRAAGNLGAPGGHLYAALMVSGCTLPQYEQIMGGMVRAGVLTRSGECYHVGPLAEKLGTGDEVAHV